MKSNMASMIENPREHKNRLSDVQDEPRRMLPPIKGFEQLEIVSLEKSVQPLISIVPQINEMVYIVKQNCQNPRDNLTCDESASIMIYSMEWSKRDESLYFILNKSLREANRQLLKPWFLYLRLFVHSLSKLPSFNQTIYRGIKMDLSKDYPRDSTFVWWGFSSCTDSIEVLQNEEFFGKNGTRTLFLIECHTGKDIRNHSMYSIENEILLVAARQFTVTSTLYTGNNLHLIQLKEIEPPFPFISCSPSIPSIILSSHQQKLRDIIQRSSMSSQINFENENINDQDLELIVQEGIINKQCQKLLLGNNQITSQGILIIANALYWNKHLEELMLFHNHIDDRGVQYLSNALQTNSSILKILGLGSNNITDIGIKYLTKMLKLNQSLCVLGLVFNHITDQGVRLLAEAISSNNTNLQVLHLSKNQLITDNSVQTFIDMLQRNQSLKELWIQNCHLSENGKQKLRQFSRSKSNFRLEF